MRAENLLYILGFAVTNLRVTHVAFGTLWDAYGSSVMFTFVYKCMFIVMYICNMRTFIGKLSLDQNQTWYVVDDRKKTAFVCTYDSC